MAIIRPQTDPGDEHVTVRGGDYSRSVARCRPVATAGAWNPSRAGRRTATPRAQGRNPAAAAASIRSLNRCSFPVSVRGSASRNSIARGYLYGAIVAFA